MDSSTLIAVLGFLFLVYFILRSKGEDQKTQAEPPPLPPSPPIHITPPPLLKPIKKTQQISDAKVKKPSRAAAIRRLALKGKNWVIMNEVFKKKFPD
jgi:hypothetical protein